MTREKAILHFERYVNDDCYTVEHREACKMAVAALREQEERENRKGVDFDAVNNWIPVAERLPDDGETVLTYKNGRVEVQMYEKMRNGWINGNWFWSMATVTHWTPIPESLPKPPKEDAP